MKVLKLLKKKPKLKGGSRGKLAKDRDLNQATADEFEREGMGIAPKE
jgi:hypothetical protein